MIARLVARAGAILCYHAVETPEAPARGVANVPLPELLGAVDLVRGIGRFVPLDELLARHAAGRSTRGLFALTFDDAYATLGHAAAPELARREVPFTTFVTSGATAAGAAFWWDRVDDLHPHVAPERWRAFEDRIGLPEAYRRGHPAAEGALRPLRQWMLAEHRGRLAAPVDDALAALERETGVRTVQRAMTWDEVAAMLALPGASLGVHTMTHPVLPLLAEEEMKREVAANHDELRERFGARTLPILAAPFALFDARTLAVAAAAGMRATLTLENRTLGAVAPHGGIPRLSMTRGRRGARLLVHAMGLVERLPSRRGGGYPALPSATT